LTLARVPKEDGLRSTRTGNHHFGRLDDGDGLVTPAQFESRNGICGNHRCQPLIADTQPHLRQQPVNANLLDETVQPVAGT
jgi:hypothetical protein